MIGVAQVQALAFSPNGQYLATASVNNNQAQIWEFRRCNAEGTVPCPYGPAMQHRMRVMDIRFSPFGDSVVTASRDNWVNIWDMANLSAPTWSFPHSAGAAAAAFSPDGKRVVSVSYEDAYLWNAANGEEICRLEGHTQAVRDASFSPDGSRVVTASEDQTVRFWNARTCAPEPRVLTLLGDSVWSARFSPDLDGKLIVVSSQNFNQARVFDSRSLHQVAALTGHRAAVFSAVFSPDGSMVATASGDNTARIWPVPTRAETSLRTLEAELCDGRLRAGLSRFSAQELSMAPVLDPQMDEDACRPPNPLDRLLHQLLGRSR
jgi:WD40 repeat protein